MAEADDDDPLARRVARRRADRRLDSKRGVRARVARQVGADTAARLRQATLAVYARGRDIARDRGILLADTKFEFGFDGDELVLADEVLTPDSSRFWPAEEWEPGRAQPSP